MVLCGHYFLIEGKSTYLCNCKLYFVCQSREIFSIKMPLDSCFKDAKKNDRTMTMTSFTNRGHLTTLPFCERRLFASTYEYSNPLPSSVQDFNLLPKKSFQFCEVFVRLDRETLHGLLHELFRKKPPNRFFPSHP